MEHLREMNIRELEEEGKAFYLPTYQRGYRWGEPEVTRLLDDIHAAFDENEKNEGHEKKKYFLQPVVVKTKVEAEKEWELIDGQQRLTTLYLIFKSLNHHSRYSLSYESTKDNFNYLNDITEGRRLETMDFCHIYYADKTIREWLRKIKSESKRHKFKEFILNNVFVLWYEVSSEVKSSEVFARLNMGKIPLTNSELIKAWLMSVDSGQQENPKIRETWNTEIGVQWDEMEHRLHQEDFWSFITNKEASNFPSRIDILFEFLLFLHKPEIKSDSGNDHYQIFYELTEIANKEGKGDPHFWLWDEVRNVFLTICHWFEDHEIYHKVGFLVAAEIDATEIDTISSLHKMYGKMNKSAFITYLDSQIKARFIRNKKPLDINKLNFEVHGDKRYITNILLLFNIVTILGFKSTLHRYPFAAHKGKKWSLEHIRPQANGKIKDSEREFWLKDQIEEVNAREQWPLDRKVMIALGLDENYNGKVDPGKINAKGIAESDFDFMVSVIITELDGNYEFDVHGLGNMALLGRDENSSLSNSIFKVKRDKILAMLHEGSFIPITTMLLFMGHFANRPVDYPRWTTEDQEAYIKEISNKLAPYLAQEESN